MIKSMYVVAASLLLALGIGIGHGLTQDMGSEKEPSDDKADTTEKWKELHKPGDQHRWLREDVGLWNVRAKHFADEGANPGVATELAGTSEISMKFDRFLYEETSIGTGENLMEMRGYTGYDNSSEQFKAFYIGNHGTGMQVFTGKRDDNRLEFTGQWKEKGLDNVTIKQRIVSVRESEDKAVVTIFRQIGDNPERKAMELTYTRR